MNEILESITILSALGEKLEGFANRENNYNSAYATYLDQLAAEMYKITTELKEINYMFGGL